MKLSRILLFAVVTIATMVLTGCSEKIVDLTPSEQNAIVSYSAHVVTKYNSNQKKGFVNLSEEYLKKLESKQTTTPTTPANNSSSGEPNKESTTKTVTAAQAVGIQGLQVVVNGMELADSYTGGSGAFDVTPLAGKKLLWVKLQITNSNTSTLSLDMLKYGWSVGIKVNGEKLSRSMVTILKDDFMTLQRNLEPGEKLDTMVFFQVSTQSAAELTKVDFIVTRNKIDYVVNVK